MKMRVEFENEADGEDITLCAEDLTLLSRKPVNRCDPSV